MFLHRKYEALLAAWKTKAGRMPLVIRGARQVGKSTLVEHFAQHYFTNLVKINFEQESRWVSVFENLNPHQLVQSISVLSGQKIILGQSLLFLDEIQNCPNAILALRYFKEQMPELHVIAAGSLLEFVLRDAKFSMPVGRIEFMFIKPVSFREYLAVQETEALNDLLENISPQKPLEKAIHQHLLAQVKNFFLLGGMPAVLASYFQNKDFLSCQYLQNNILQTYQFDFGKYAALTQHKYVQKLFERLPFLVCQTFKYSSVDQETRTEIIKNSLQLLEQAGLVYRVYSTLSQGFPLRSQINEKKFKLLFLDIGLLQRSLQLDATIMATNELLPINAGVLAEQFVGQELLVYQDALLPADLFYWERNKKSSMAEVDYVMTYEKYIIPIEVKAGKIGRLKSLQIFMEEHASFLGIKISEEPLKLEKNILIVPFYLISEIPRLVREILG